MDCEETALLRKISLRQEMMMLSSSSPTIVHHHHHHHHQALLSPEEAAPAWAPLERGGFLVGEDFSVDDLLDLGGGKGHGEEKEEEEEVEEEEREDSPNNSNTSSALSFQVLPATDPIVPDGDIEELEWVSRFVDDSYSEFPSSAISPPYHHQQHQHAPPPLPPPLIPKPQTLETQSGAAATTTTTTSLKRTWDSCCFSTDSLVVPAKARSKRSRTGGRVWSLCRPPQLAESSSSSCPCASSSSSCSYSSSLSSCLIYDNLAGVAGGGEDPDLFLDCLGGKAPLKPQLPPLLVKKKKGRKPKALVVAAEANSGGDLHARRRCSHCGVDKTPQWRAGPMGVKTLCNACGVRYKSGRLLPEYRPAGSPTFLSHVHSNSHRKVLDMRRKKEILDASSSAAASGYSSAPPLLPQMHRPAAQPHGVV